MHTDRQAGKGVTKRRASWGAAVYGAQGFMGRRGLRVAEGHRRRGCNAQKEEGTRGIQNAEVIEHRRSLCAEGHKGCKR